MDIRVNGNVTEIEADATLDVVLQALDLPERGVAVAVNNRMVTRGVWSDTVLHENDNVLIIKAACGG